MTKRGRPSKISAKKIATVLDCLKLGASRAVAADYAGVNVATLYAWIAKGKTEERGHYRDLYDGIKRAESECTIRDLQILSEASLSDWRAAAFRLERRVPEYAKNPQPTVAVNVDAREINIMQLIQELQSTDQLIKSISPPIIDLDE